MSAPQIIVVGAGLSGLAAAHTLYEKGANVLVLEKNPFAGGNSTKATSGINGAGTKAQEKLGIKDSAKAFFDDTKKSARDLARDDLIEVLTGKSGETVNWLTSAFGLDLSLVSRLGGHSFERTHRGGEKFPGMTITYALMEKLEELAEKEPARVKILKKANVGKLLKDGDKVIGVEYQYQGKKQEAHGPVILSTGGYAVDFQPDGLLAKYRPELLSLSTTNGEHSQGDGHKMALAIGASAVDLEKVQVHPTGLVDPADVDAKVKFLAAEALRGVGGLLLDSEGDRFCDELGHRDYVTGRMNENNKYPVRLILNGQASKEIEWHAKHYTGRGLMKKFNNIDEVAKEMGVSKDKLRKTLDAYESIAVGKSKDPYGKKFFHNNDWSDNAGPYHVALMQPVLHYTMGGLEIDPQSHVLDLAHKPIPGLFASGEIAGGVHGANRLGGSSLLGCCVFGRVAADTAASYLLHNLSCSPASSAATRLGQVQGHLTPLATTITVDPQSQKVNVSFSWAGDNTSSTPSSSGSGGAQEEVKAEGKSTAEQPANEKDAAVKHDEGGKKAELKVYSLEDVAKHNTKDDCWVVVNGQVLDATSFLPDHPGGAKAILLYAGRDATEEFNMLHEANVVDKYAPNIIIGTLKA